MADVDVVIVAYRNGTQLENCLRALDHDPVVASVHVVDNAQQPDVCAAVRRWGRPGRPVTCTPQPNIGFSRACNLAAARGCAANVALVNPDLVLTASLAGPRDLLGVRPELAATGLLRTGRDVPSNIKHGISVRRELLRLFVGSRRAYAVRPPAGVPVWHASHADGALLVLRRSTWEQLGGLDERYELYYEDVDLTVRTGGVAVLAMEVGTHDAGSSSAQATAAVLACLQISRLRWLRTQRRPLAAVLLSLLEWCARSVTGCAEGQVARNASLRLVVRELKKPGSVQVLGA